MHMPPLDGRLIQLWLYGRSHPDDNHYAHPIDVVVLVDLNLKKVRLLCVLHKLMHMSSCKREPRGEQ